MSMVSKQIRCIRCHYKICPVHGRFLLIQKFACVAKKVAKKYKTTVYSNAQSNVLIWKSLIINHDKHLLFSDFFTLWIERNTWITTSLISLTPQSFPTVFSSCYQCFESEFIESGSGSSILGWILIRIRIQSGSRVSMTKNLKKLQLKKKFDIFFLKNCNLLIPRSP